MKTPKKPSPLGGFPPRGGLRLAEALSLLVALLMTAASLAGLLYPAEVYPAEESRLSFMPNDAINLVIGFPALLGSLWLSRRGRLIGLLFWPGALLYVLYNYLAYLVGLPFGILTLPSLVLVALSTYTLIGLAAGIDGQAVQRQLSGAVPERLGGGVLAGLGILVLLRAGAVVGAALADGSAPAAAELGTLVADFLICPAWIVGGVLLWRRKALGYVAGAGLLFQTSTLFLGLIGFMILQPVLTAAPVKAVDILVVFLMGMICFIPFALFVRGVVSGQHPPGR